MASPPASVQLPPLPPPDPPVVAQPWSIPHPQVELDEPDPPDASVTPPDTRAMHAVLDAIDLSPCSGPALHSVGVSAYVTFEPSGDVRRVYVYDRVLVGQIIARCIEGRLRAAHVEAFEGAPVTFHRLIELP